MKEGTSFYVQLPDGKRIAAGQIYDGRWVYWSSQKSWMVKYHTWKGFPDVVAHAVWEAGIEEVDLLRPKATCWRAKVCDLVRAPLHTVRNEAQRFLHADMWTLIQFYDKPDYRTAVGKTVDFEVGQ